MESSSIPDYSRLIQAIQLLSSSLWQGCHALYTPPIQQLVSFLHLNSSIHSSLLSLRPITSYSPKLSSCYFLLLSLPKWASSCCSSYSVPERLCRASSHQIFTPLFVFLHPPPFPSLHHTEYSLSQFITKGLWGAVWLCRALASHLLNHQSAVRLLRLTDTSLLLVTYAERHLLWLSLACDALQLRIQTAILYVWS